MRQRTFRFHKMRGIFGKAAELLAYEGLTSAKEPNWIMRGYKTAVCGRACGLNTLQKRLTVKENILSWKNSFFFFLNNLRCGILITTLFVVTVRASTAVNRRHHHSVNGGIWYGLLVYVQYCTVRCTVPESATCCSPHAQTSKFLVCLSYLTFTFQSPVVTICTTNSTSCPNSVIMCFCMDLRTNSHYFPIQH